MFFRNTKKEIIELKQIINELKCSIEQYDNESQLHRKCFNDKYHDLKDLISQCTKLIEAQYDLSRSLNQMMKELKGIASTTRANIKSSKKES